MIRFFAFSFAGMSLAVCGAVGLSMAHTGLADPYAGQQRISAITASDPLLDNRIGPAVIRTVRVTVQPVAPQPVTRPAEVEAIPAVLMVTDPNATRPQARPQQDLQDDRANVAETRTPSRSRENRARVVPQAAPEPVAVAVVAPQPTAPQPQSNSAALGNVWATGVFR